MDNINESLFEPILGKDEKILKVIKPNKKRYILLSMIVIYLGCTIFLGFLIAMCLCGGIKDESGEVIGKWMAIPFIVILVFIYAITAFCLFMGYKKAAYCYTNKRIIIRSGVVGVDFKVLDYELIGAIEVRVGIVDKLIRKNTGTISFCSAAMMSAESKAMFSFLHVDNPYNLYKEVKEVFDDFKINKQK